MDERTTNSISVDTITQAVQATWQGTRDPRLRQLLTDLVPYLHDYVRSTKLTHADWLAGIDFLMKVGAISDANRNEFSLLSDVLGITSLVDLQNATPGATVGSVLGPFYVDNSPLLPLGGDLVKENSGDVVLLCGAVRDQDDNPLKGATIDLWQTDIRGQYAVADSTQEHNNLRCRQNCDDHGNYWLTTVLPAPYSIPMDGPVGHLFKDVGRSEWRPAHYHFIVRAPGARPIITEVFFRGGAYVEGDAVFGVRAPLIVSIEDVSDQTVLPKPLERRPAKCIRFNFKLAAEAGAQIR